MCLQLLPKGGEGWNSSDGRWYRLFHAHDAATGKARSPRVNHCTDGTTSVMVVGEQRWRRPSTSAVRHWSIETLECQNAETELNPFRDPQPVTVAKKHDDVFGAPGWEHESGSSIEDGLDDWRHRPARNSSSRPDLVIWKLILGPENHIFSPFPLILSVRISIKNETF